MPIVRRLHSCYEIVKYNQKRTRLQQPNLIHFSWMCFIFHVQRNILLYIRHIESNWKCLRVNVSCHLRGKSISICCCSISNEWTLNWIRIIDSNKSPEFHSHALHSNRQRNRFRKLIFFPSQHLQIHTIQRFVNTKTQQRKYLVIYFDCFVQLTTIGRWMF